jgi:hypothetical protein
LADHIYEYDDDFELFLEAPQIKVDYDFFVVRKPSSAQVVFNKAHIYFDNR